MYFPFPKSLVPATFVRRVNRFVAEVELDGKVTQVHVPNTGRMAELLVDGHPVCLLPSDSPTRKTRFDLLLVRYDDTWVCVDSRQANEVVHRLFICLCEGQTAGLPEPTHPLWDQFRGVTDVAREVGWNRHRFDFRLQRDEENIWVEVKSVNLVVGGQARFPDAPTERGKEHVRLLAELVSAGDRAYVLFVVQRDDADSFAPNRAMDKAFADALQEAAERGVQVHALKLRMTPEGAHLNAVLPVEVNGAGTD